jgi:transposase
LATQLGIAAITDRNLFASGRRAREHETDSVPVRLPPRKNDGLSVGESMTLIAIGRACHPTSKRAFAEWANSTTLGELAGVDVDRLTSQHFWDQMDQVPIDCIGAIERETIETVLGQFELPVDLLLYDATNFFTFIASTNRRAEVAARGHNKQKRDDLRQVGVALLCTREHGIPLWHQTYEGQMADPKSFEVALPAIRQRLLDWKIDLDKLTVVYDKGNVSEANQKRVDSSGFHYLTGLTVASQKELVAEANQKLEPVALRNGESVMAYRTQRTIWKKCRTVVVLVSEQLKEGQIRGILQHVESAQRWLSRLADTLRRGKQRRSRAAIERDIENRLKGRQYLRKVLRYQLLGEDPQLTLTYEFSQADLDKLATGTLGRLVLATDRHNWSTAEIIESYRSQAAIEALFAHLKHTDHIGLRPQFHWTTQKLHVHVHTCVQGHLLARLLALKAERAGRKFDSQEQLLDTLEKIRKATILRFVNSKRKPSILTELEEVDPTLSRLLPALGIIC